MVQHNQFMWVFIFRNFLISNIWLGSFKIYILNNKSYIGCSYTTSLCEFFLLQSFDIQQIKWYQIYDWEDKNLHLKISWVLLHDQFMWFFSSSSKFWYQTDKIWLKRLKSKFYNFPAQVMWVFKNCTRLKFWDQKDKYEKAGLLKDFKFYVCYLRVKSGFYMIGKKFYLCRNPFMIFGEYVQCVWSEKKLFVLCLYSIKY